MFRTCRFSHLQAKISCRYTVCRIHCCLSTAISLNWNKRALFFFCGHPGPSSAVQFVCRQNPCSRNLNVVDSMCVNTAILVLQSLLLSTRSSSRFSKMLQILRRVGRLSSERITPSIQFRLRLVRIGFASDKKQVSSVCKLSELNPNPRTPDQATLDASCKFLLEVLS